MIFFYVRHGDPIYNPDSLTPLGERQAEALAKRLCMHGVNKVYASTSNRAILTAKPTAEQAARQRIEQRRDVLDSLSAPQADPNGGSRGTGDKDKIGKILADIDELEREVEARKEAEKAEKERKAEERRVRLLKENGYNY